MSIGVKQPSQRTISVQQGIEEELSKYRHVIKTRVRTYDVDRQGIVHNAVYLYWLEAARVEYFRAIGLPLDKESFVTKHRFVVARAELDYFFAAQFDDEYEIYTRVPWVKNSSFGFDQVVRLTDGGLIMRATATLVHLNPATHHPERIQEAYRKLIKEYEGTNATFLQ